MGGGGGGLFSLESGFGALRRTAVPFHAPDFYKVWWGGCFGNDYKIIVVLGLLSHDIPKFIVVKGIIMFYICAIFDRVFRFCIRRVAIDEFAFGIEFLIHFVCKLYLFF